MKTIVERIAFGDPARVTRMLRRMGPIAVKAGQYLSLRRDLLPREFTDELLKLTDDGPILPWAELKEILTADLGSAPELIFSYIDRAPMASGSLAQVHRARLPDGTEVAIKIKRPGIEEAIARELKQLRRLAVFLARSSADLAINPRELIDEIAGWLKHEVDFVRELENARRLRRMAIESTIQRIPLVYPSLSSQRIVTYEWLRGIPVSAVLSRQTSVPTSVRTDRDGAQTNSQAGDMDQQAIAANLMEACLTQIFRYRFFHADLHPGNLLILESDVIGFVDFGFCDALDDSVRRNQLRYLTAAYNDDASLMFKALTEILIAGEMADSEGFRRDFLNVRRKLEGRNDESDQPAGDYLSGILKAARRNGYQVPTSILSIYRALLTAESVAAQLGLADGIREIGRKFFTELQSQELYAQLFDRDQLRQVFMSLLNLTRDGPKQVNQILSELADGTLSLKVEVSEDPRIAKSRRQRARMQVCAILSVGVAVLMAMPNPPRVFGLAIQRLLGLVLVGLYVAVIYFWRQL